MAKALPGYGGGRLPGGSTREKGREEEKEEEDRRERQVRNEIAQDVAAGIEKTASAHEDAQADRTKNSWVRCRAKLGLGG